MVGKNAMNMEGEHQIMKVFVYNQTSEYDMITVWSFFRLWIQEKSLPFEIC